MFHVFCFLSIGWLAVIIIHAMEGGGLGWRGAYGQAKEKRSGFHRILCHQNRSAAPGVSGDCQGTSDGAEVYFLLAP